MAKLNQLSGPQAKAPDVYYAFAGAATFFNELLGVQGRNVHQRSKSQRLHAQGNAMAMPWHSWFHAYVKFAPAMGHWLFEAMESGGIC